MLVRKGKVWVEDEVIHQTDQFAHDCDQTDLWGFTVGFESLVKGREDGVAPCCANGGHVEHVAHLPAACAYMARGLTMAGVSWVRGDSDQGGELRRS